MKKIGITGQNGFVGYHLYQTVNLFKDEFQLINFDRSFFMDDARLAEFVSQCDVIVHLAALNRHNNPQVLYETNIVLVQKLIQACEQTHSTPHILFSSSTQEERDNLYGKSKKEGRELFEKWAYKNNAQFTGFIIPNLFGPFCSPFYNSVVATFCYQLTHKKTPSIDVDGEIKMLYIGELVNEIINHIEFVQLECVKKGSIYSVKVPYSCKMKVSELLKILETYTNSYFEKGIIPPLDTIFNRNLFNTFLCYIDYTSFFPFHLRLNTDERGSFVETVKLNSGGQVSFSTTLPGITRGNHFHTRKAERFAVIKGKGRIDLRRIGNTKIYSFDLDGSQPSFVDMPVWHTHKITNIGNEELYTIFWINEHFNQNDQDTFLEDV